MAFAARWQIVIKRLSRDRDTVCCGGWVRLWPKCEVPRRPTWVCYWALNRRDSDMVERPPLTQLGHQCANFAVMHNTVSIPW